MKTYLLIGLLIASSAILKAQDVGQFWVGGTVGFSKDKTTVTDEDFTPKTNSFRIIPEFGYVLNDRWGVGIATGYNTGNQDFEKSIYVNLPFNNSIYIMKPVNIKTQSFKVAPFARYAVWKGDIGSFFVDGGVGYEYSKSTEEVKEYTTTTTKVNTFSVGLSPGVTVNLSPKVSLIGKFGFLGYEHSRNNQQIEWLSSTRPNSDTESKTNSFGLDFHLNSIGLGAIFNF